jgi:hypothetical protein
MTLRTHPLGVRVWCPDAPTLDRVGHDHDEIPIDARLDDLAPSAFRHAEQLGHQADRDPAPPRRQTDQAKLLGTETAAHDAFRLALRSAWRGRSLTPPQMPNRSPVDRANSRHATRTEHCAHTALAISTGWPRSGKNRSVCMPRHAASSCHAGRVGNMSSALTLAVPVLGSSGVGARCESGAISRQVAARLLAPRGPAARPEHGTGGRSVGSEGCPRQP